MEFKMDYGQAGGLGARRESNLCSHSRRRLGLRRSSDFRQITELNLNTKSFIFQLKERTFDGDKKEKHSHPVIYVSSCVRNSEKYRKL
jgi:hypothetical protein